MAVVRTAAADAARVAAKWLAEAEAARELAGVVAAEDGEDLQ